MLKFFFLFSSLLAQEPYLNFKNMKEVKADCEGYSTPGKQCILHCVTATNSQTDRLYDCNLHAKGIFTERSSENTLIATDIRSIIVYPLQKTEVCFNFGKTTTDFWELSKWEIQNPNDSCQEILTDYRLYIVTSLRNNFFSKE